LFKVALKELEKAINSEEFKRRVLNFSYINEYGLKINGFKECHTAQHGLLSNQQFYDLIMSGYDSFNRRADGDLDIDVSLYLKKYSSTVGYTYPNTFATWINTKFWRGQTHAHVIAQMASNPGHEYIHNMGLGHDHKNNPTREFTGPYGIGNIIYDIVLENNKQVQMKKVCSGFWWWRSCHWEKQ
jgi:hypothetical protein